MINGSQCNPAPEVNMLNAQSQNNIFELSEGFYVQNKHNSTRHKWSKFRCYVAKKCANIRVIKDKSVYIETLSASSVKRTLRRFYRNIFKSRHQGYEKFLTDEEKRFLLTFDGRGLVEGY